MAGSSLPGGSSLPANAKKSGAKKHIGAAPDVETRAGTDGKYDELDFSQMAEQDADLRKAARAKSEEELKKIRKKRELEELTGKKSSGDQVSLDQLQTEMEGDKGGLPPHLAALPKDHPLRVRWEKGFRIRPDGTWYAPLELRRANRRKQMVKYALFFWLPVILLGIGLVVGTTWYAERMASVREEIIDLTKKKSLDLKDPEIKGKMDLVRETTWLPDLRRLLEEFKKIPRNFSVFEDNPEPGSYIDYIKRHNLPFVQRDAVEWRTRIIRKPSK